jgi:alpha-glucosidase
VCQGVLTDQGFESVGDAVVQSTSAARVRLRAGDAVAEVAAVAPGVFRVGLFGAGRPPVYDSPALAPADPAPVTATVTDAGDELTIEMPEGAARIALRPLRISFSDPEGRVVAADDPELGMGFAGAPDPFAAPVTGDGPRLVKRREAGERFFGCGERTAGLEKTGSHQLFWNVDPPAGHTASFNNLYTSIPFAISLRHGRAHGLLLDSTHRVEIDLAAADPDRVAYAAGGGDLVYYVFLGPTPRDLLDRFTQLTGRTPLPPLWALGNQQSRWSYADADELRAVAAGFRDRGIPCDVLYLDIDYMDGYRVFTWDRERFPDPAGLLAELREQGFRVVTIIDPGVKVDTHFPLYAEGRERGYFCLTRDGAEYRNVVWPGLCAFPDFTDPAVREWWGDHHAALLDAGVAGIWCDMNEPGLFVPEQSTMPPDVVHPGGGRTRHHAEVHNAYGQYMAQATREGLARHRPDERPFVISRAGYAGLQRHALQWTGDNSSWWEHVWMGMPQLQNLGLSGIAWAGVDIGGFFGDSNGELVARWTEFGAFQPFCRNHSSQGTVAQEPWAFGEPFETACRDMLRLRMRLLPYLYTLFEECHRTGAPILRPLLFEHPGDETTYTADDEFLLGPALLVAPITRPGIEHRHVYLPAGTWVQWWTGERVDGPAHVLAHAPLGRPALYVRANTPIPLWPELEHTGRRPDTLTWLVHPAAGAPPGEAALYEDAGDGYGDHARRTVTAETGGEGSVTVRLSARSGDYVPARTRVVVEIAGRGSAELPEAADGAVIER